MQSLEQAAPPPDLPLTVTMTLQQWRTLLALLAEGSHQLRIVGPIYGHIERTCGEQIQRWMAAARPNGEAREGPSDARQ